MTKVWLMSDLHLDLRMPRHRTSWHVPECDVLVVAGDIMEGSVLGATHWLHTEFVLRGVEVVGNHEYYGGNSPTEGFEAAREAAPSFPGVHLLERESVVISGTRFLGCTLWTDFALGAQTTKEIVSAEMAAVGIYGGLPGDLLAAPSCARAPDDRTCAPGARAVSPLARA